MRPIDHRAFALMAATGLLALHEPACAQHLEPPPPRFPRDRNIAVGERVVPGYEALGVDLGSFTLFPSIAATATYSDNVFAQEIDERDDIALRIASGLRFRSNFPVHRMSVNFVSQIDRFADLKTENTERFDADAQGLYEVSRATSVRMRLRWQRLQEPRSSQNAFVQTLEPLRYELTTAAIGVSQDFNRIRLIAETAVVKTNYFNGRLADGTVLRSANRDNTALSVRGRVEFAQTPGLSYFVQATASDRDFRAGSASRPQRDSKVYEILGGINFEPSALARGEIGIGYLRQNFVDPFYNDSGNFGVNARVKLFPSQLTTFTIEADRRAEDSGNPNSGSFLSTAGALKIDHELLRTLIISAAVDYEVNDYRDIDREDQRYGFGLGAEYRINRMIAINASASHLKVNSDGLDRYRDYSENRFLIGISFRS